MSELFPMHESETRGRLARMRAEFLRLIETREKGGLEGLPALESLGREIERMRRYLGLPEMGAVLSPCKLYRYSLFRTWDKALPVLASCGLNPSTADAYRDDATIRKEMRYAKAWGFGGLVKINLFAYRSTDPDVLATRPDTHDPENHAHIMNETKGRTVLCGWGVGGELYGQGSRVLGWLRHAGRSLVVLGFTKDGHPRHPLYTKGNLQPVAWL